MDNKYSNWLKIDLHIHSNFSDKTKDRDYKGAFSVGTLKQKLIENDVAIFSITDHNIINVEAYREYYNDYKESEDPLLLLGLELDILVSRKAKERTYHTLLIFNCHKIETVESINATLESIYTNKNINDLKQRKVTIEDIATYFKELDFFFIPHAYSDKDIVTAYKDGAIEEAQKMVLLMSCALEKVTREEVIEAYNNGFNNLLTANFQSKNDIPYINFSDNHCIDNYPCRHKGENNIGNHDFYYIKGSKNFESIRLAFIDPSSRIKTSTQYNDINHLNNTIDSLKIKDADSIDNTVLKFSPHLNVIIGGRSSGKSLLMWLLGKKINTSVPDDKYKKYNSDCVLIKSKNDSDYVFTTAQSDLIYIKQGDIINYFEDGKLEELARKSKKFDDYNNCKAEFQTHKTTLNNIVSEFIDTYKNVYDNDPKKSFTLHGRTIDNILSDHFIIKLDKEELLRLDKSQLITDSENLLVRLQADIDMLSTSQILKLTETESQLIVYFKKLIQDKTELLQKKTSINSLKNKFINEVNAIISASNGTLNQEAKEKEQSNSNLKRLINEINKLFIDVHSLVQKSKKLEEFTLSHKQSFNVEQDINLVLDASTNSSTKDLILDGINNSDTNKSLFYNMLSLLYKPLSFKNIGGNTPDNLRKKIESQLKTAKSNIDLPMDYLEYEDGETSKDKSPGYNSEKYLDIVLNNPDVRIVFIDQPEDNLGNKFIAETLVTLIRKIKFKKQIFLVTHNPSVVVYGDAESVILAKNNDNQISYEQITLEKSAAQKEICDVLDGGEYIFNNRYKKYNIQRILKKS